MIIHTDLLFMPIDSALDSESNGIINFAVKVILDLVNFSGAIKNRRFTCPPPKKVISCSYATNDVLIGLSNDISILSV